MPTFSFHWYGFIVGLAIITCYELVKKLTSSDPAQQKAIEGGFIPVVIGGLIGARTYHVLDQFSYYHSHPIQILYLHQGGLGILGALIGGFLGGLIYLYQTKALYLLQNLAQSIFTVLPLGQAIGRLGNYVNKELFGLPTNLPWGMTDAQGVTRHPLFFYEAVLNLILFVFLITRRDKTQNIAIYLIGYGLIRFFLEYLREPTDTWIVASASIAQLISVTLIVVGILLNQRYRSQKP